MSEPPLYRQPAEEVPCACCLAKLHVYDDHCEGCQKRYQERIAFTAQLAKARIRPK